MSATLRVARVGVQPLAIPMRLRFEHAAAARAVADPVLVRLVAAPPHDALSGWGETLARSYVTGETTASVIGDLIEHFAPRLAAFHAASFAEALEWLDDLPLERDGRRVHAARAALELAVLDLAGRMFHRRPADAAGWMDLPGPGGADQERRLRYSGIVVGRSPRKLGWALRAQRCYGLRDFKLKAGMPGWELCLEQAARLLRRGIERGSVTLRVDANGAWTAEQALEALPLLDACDVCAVEQPLPPAQDARLAELSARGFPDIIADESLVSLADVDRLLELGVRVFNVRIAKVGGLMPALRMAQRALAAGADVQLGCLVGETSLLSAAGVEFATACPRLRFVEGAFGRWLLRGDVTRRPVQFGHGGRVRRPAGFGLGVVVHEDLVRRWSAEGGRALALG